MNDMDQTRRDQWRKNNEAYLEAALAWLRLLLEQRAGPLAPALPTPPPTRNRFFERRPVSPPNPFEVIPSPKVVTDADVTMAANAMKAAEAVQPPPVLLML